MVVPVLRNEMIDFTLERRSPSDEERAQHVGPPLISLVFHE